MAEVIFRRLAGVEAKAHGSSPEAVLFHEVGAVGAIVNIVGTGKSDFGISNPLRVRVGEKSDLAP
jgi:uncharacterized protein (DUF111 family)